MIGMLLAQQSLKDAYKLNPITNTRVSDVFATPADFFNKLIIPNMYLFAGLIFFALLVGGGIMVVTSGGDPKGTEKGMQTVKTAVAGFLVIFLAYWVIQIIERATGQPILSGGF
ncbi:MAG TPA: hypothetical protein VJ246_03770 [Patescibacteria group bacterium]|nr:hypothetical protein [Patescibacteria group bacterium]